MQGYIVSRSVTVRSASQVKHIPASASFQTFAVGEVQIGAANEAKLVLEQLKRDWPGVPADSLFKSVPHEALARWPHFPMILGRQATASDEISNVLANQLGALRARHPQRKHFRLLIHNGFGSNLGDTLVGLTAFRSVWQLLKTHLPEVSVDVLVGWLQRDAVAGLLKQCEGLEDMLYQGPTLQSLGRYQGLFDTSGLVTLPRYGTMPAVDWYLWWMGLNPSEIDDIEKRNRITLDPKATSVIAARLDAVGAPRILLNPMASEPLRRMPLATVRSLAGAVLDADPTAQVVFDQPVPFVHPRVHSLADLITSPDLLAALVAQVDGIITPDTFLQHVADATATPTCTLSTSVPAAFFRYYPFGTTLVLPGAEGLPGWGRTKVSEAQWKFMKSGYNEAWARLDHRLVLSTLAKAQRARALAQPPVMPRIDLPRPPFRRAIAGRAMTGSASLVPQRQKEDRLATALQRILVEQTDTMLLSGETVVVLGAGAGELAVTLAQRVAPTGRLVAFEPRRLIHQILCANLVLAGCDGVQTYPAMPVGYTLIQSQMQSLAPQDEHVAIDVSNQLVCEPVLSWPLDLLELPQCSLIVLQRPVPFALALKGAFKTVTRLRPTLVAAGVKPEELATCQFILQGLDYRLELLPLGEARDHIADTSVLVAKPRRTAVPRQGT